MKFKSYRLKNNHGLSPIIGVVLLVALVVALVVLASVIVFNMSGDGETSADASIDFSQTSSGVSVQVVSNNNVDEFRVLFPDGTEQTLSGNVGSSLNLVGPEGQYVVVAVMPDGEKQTLLTKNVSGLDYSGIFIVSQDAEEKEVYARLENEYDNIDDYDLNLEAQNNNDEDVLINNYSNFNNYLLSTGVISESDSVQTEIFKLMSISVNPDKIDIGEDIATIGETIAIHEMVNLCNGDRLILEDSDTGDELTSEEIIVNSDCGELRKVAKYKNGKITAVELINLWNQDLEYFVFQYDGQPQPELPTHPAPIDEENGVDVKAKVIDNNTGELIEDATVVIGDKSKKTNSEGEAIFRNIDSGVKLSTSGNNIDAVAYKPGYLPSPVRTIPVEGEWTNPQEEEFKLDDFEPESPTQKKGTISSSNTARISVSGGSGGGSTIVGGGGFTGGGSSGGSSSSGSSWSSGGGSGFYYENNNYTPVTFSSSTPISQPIESTSTIPQPERLFNIIEIDDSLIPQGEEFMVRTTVGTTIDESLDDAVEIYKIESSAEINDITSDNLIGSENITIPEDDTITNEQNLSINSIGEYTIYVSLRESNKYKVAGTLEVFDSNRENAKLNGGSITPEDAGIDEDVTIEIDRADINFSGADGATVDIFENGIRVAEGEIMDKSDSALEGDEKNKLKYVTSYSQPQYAQYHAGIQESQHVYLLDTKIISDEIKSNEISEFTADAEIINKNDVCNTGTDTSEQFDCEIIIGDHNPLEFSAENSSFKDSDGNQLDMNYEWILGSERTISIDDKSEIIPQTFEDDTVHLVEFRASTNINDNTYEKRVPFMINAITEDDAEETTTEDEEIGDFDVQLITDSSYEVGEDIQPVIDVDNISESDISKYTWQFDSDSSYNTDSDTTSKYYSKSGTYSLDVTVTATDGSTSSTSVNFDVVGDDATLVDNNLQSAINNANDGDILVASGENYDGVTINKSITILTDNNSTIDSTVDITSSNVVLDGFNIDSRVNTRNEYIELSNLHIDSNGWGLVIYNNNVEITNVSSFSSSNGAMTVQSNVANVTIRDSDAKTSGSGYHGLRLQENTETTVYGGSYRATNGDALRSTGDGVILSMGNTELTGSINSFNLNQDIELTFTDDISVHDGEGMITAMSLAANEGDTLDMTKYSIINNKNGDKIRNAGYNIFDNWGYQITDPHPVYGSNEIYTNDLSINGDSFVSTDTLIIHDNNVQVSDINVRATSSNYGIETKANNITLSNIEINNPYSYVIVNRNNDLKIDNSYMYGKYGVHTNSGTSGLTLHNNYINTNSRAIRILDNSDEITISHNEVHSNSHGIQSLEGSISTIRDNIITSSNNAIHTESSGQLYIENNKIDSNRHALPHTDIDIQLKDNTIVNGEFLSGLVTSASPGDSISISNTVATYDNGPTIDVSETTHSLAPTRIYNADINIGATDDAPKLNYLLINNTNVELNNLKIEPTYNEYAIETFAENITLNNLDIDNSNNWNIVSRSSGLTVSNSELTGDNGIHMDSWTTDTKIDNNTIDVKSRAVRPSDNAQNVVVTNNNITSNSYGINSQEGVEIYVEGNIINSNNNPIYIRQDNAATIRDNTITNNLGSLLSTLDYVSETNDHIKINKDKIVHINDSYTIFLEEDAENSMFDETDIYTNNLKLEFLENMRIHNGGDRAIHLRGDDIELINAHLTGQHGVEMRGQGNRIIDSYIDVSSWGVLIRNSNNDVYNTHIRAKDGIHTNSDLIDINIENNAIISSDKGVRAQSGTTGTVYSNNIDSSGTALTTANMDVQNNDLEKLKHNISPSNGNPDINEEVSFTTDIHQSIDVSTIQWEMGDGTEYKYGDSTTYSYEDSGKMTVTVTVNDIYGNEFVDTNDVNVNPKDDTSRFNGDEIVISDSDNLDTELNNLNSGDTVRIESGTYEPVDINISDLTIIAENDVTINGGRSYISAKNISIENINHKDRIDVDDTGFRLIDSKVENPSGWGVVIWNSDAVLDNNYIESESGVYVYTNKNNIILSDNIIISSGEQALRARSGSDVTLNRNNLDGDNAVRTESSSSVSFNNDILTANSNKKVVDSKTSDYEVTNITVNDGKLLDFATRTASSTDEIMTLKDGSIEFSSGHIIHTNKNVYYSDSVYSTGLTITTDGSAEIGKGSSHLYMKSNDMIIKNIDVNKRIEPEGSNIQIKNTSISEQNNWGIVMRNSDISVDDVNIDSDRGIYIDSDSNNADLNSVTLESQETGILLRNGPNNINMNNIDVISNSDNALKSEGSNPLELTNSKFTSMSNDAMRLEGGETILSDIIIESPNEAISVSGSSTDIVFNNNIQVLNGDILSAADRGANTGDELQITNNYIQNTDSDYQINVSNKHHGSASIHTNSIKLSTEDASIGGLDIYGDNTVLDGVESNAKNNRIDVYADDVLIKDSDIINNNDWGIVVRNNRITVENTNIDANRGMYLDSNTNGHKINNSDILAEDIDIDLNYGVSDVIISNSTLLSENSHVITNDGTGGDLTLSNVIIDGPNGLSLNQNTDVKLQNNIEFIEGAQNSLSSLFLANDDGTETIINDKNIENKQDTYLITTNTNEYNQFDITGNNQEYTIQSNEVSFGYSRIYGKDNVIRNGLYYSPDEHSIEIYGANNTVKDTDIHNRNRWGIVIRSDDNNIQNSYIRAKTGIYVDSNLANNTVSNNEIDVDYDDGVRYLSGSTGLIESNTIINGNPAITPADADVENNTIE